MKPIFWVAALAVLSIACTGNSTSKSKPKRQLESLRTPQHLQYSLVLPNSRVSQFRSLTANRRISNISPRTGKLPPYAVQMEPVVQYSQKDPLYDPNLDQVDDAVNKNEIYAQPKVLNIHGADQASEGTYGLQFGSLPTAPLYSHEPHHPHYYEAPEPIIEIIIKESNETLPAPPPQPIQKKKKEPVQVFYVKYSKDPHAHDKVIYEKPIPAITPPSNDEDDHQEDYVTVTPEPYYVQPQTTTLRAIIKPESEVYHSDSSVKVTFGSEGNHHNSQYSDRREGSNEEREETAPYPAIAFPHQPPTHPPQDRPARTQVHDGSRADHHQQQNYRSVHQPQPQQQFAQSRIQFQPPYLANEQQLPKQGPPIGPFRGPVARQNPFGPSPPSGPIPGHLPGPISLNGPHFPNNGPPFPGPTRPAFPTSHPRPSEPQTFHPRPNSPPLFGARPPFNGPPGPPRPAFHSGPQRPFHQPPSPQPFFDEAKYLQENYHTITTEQVDPPKEQVLPERPPQNFNFLPKPSPSGPPSQFQDHLRPQHIPSTQLLPQQRPHQQFSDNAPKASFSGGPIRSPFYNLKPSPPHIEPSHTPFQQQSPQNQFSFHQGVQNFNRPPQRFPESLPPSPSPIPEAQFLPQPASPPQFSFHAQPSPSPDRPNHFHQNAPSEPQQHFHHFNNPSERPILKPNHPQNNFQDQINLHHQQNVGQFVPNGGELVAAIPKYEQHITVSGPTAQPDYNLIGQPSHQQPSPSPSAIEQYRQQQQQRQHQHEQQHQQQHQQQQEDHQRQQQRQENQQRQEQQQLQEQQQRQEHQQRQEQQQRHEQQRQEQQQRHEQQIQQQYHQQQQQQQYDNEQEQVRQQLAQNVQKQQEEIQRLQSQLLIAQQQTKQFNFNQQIEASSVKPQYSQERSRNTYQPNFPSSTASPPYYQSTSRTVEIKPTTQKYVSSTINSISTTSKPQKQEKKKKPTYELPDEVPDDLRQQLLSSGILDNADISILDYDKVGDTPLDSLPPDQLANFFSAGGAQQIAASNIRPIVVSPEGDNIQSRIDEEEDDDQELAASENIAAYVAPPTTQKQAVEMKVVHFDPASMEGEKIAQDYVREDATRLEPVALNDKKYNRYLPLKVSGNQFPLPDVLKGKKVTSVVVLAPVETEALNDAHKRPERATTTNLKGIKFVAGESLQDLLKRPTKENFEKWIDTEKKTASDLQSVVLLVTGNDEESAESKEIFMYDVSTGSVNKLNGDLSNAFVEAAENNSLSRDIEKLAIQGEGTPESFKMEEEEETADGSDNVPLLVDLSGLSLDRESRNQVSISSGYSKTKTGRSLEEH